MKQFQFAGVIPASKSLMNRALIAQSYDPDLTLLGSSRCEDVLHLQKSLKSLRSKKTFDCGEGGTTLRFLAFRVSREKGNFFLKGTPRLLKRPQTEIKNILAQLGVQVEFEKTGLRIISEGWKQPKKPLVVDAKDSSQFLSAVFLNAWDLKFNLQIRVKGKITSESYFEMTTKMLKGLGLRYRKSGNSFVVPKHQKVKVKKYRVESDVSSIFTVAAFAALGGIAKFQEFPEKSLQPDRQFLSFFKQMKITVQTKKNLRIIKASPNFHPLTADLQNSPDLFPVLAVLCAFSNGKSLLYGAPQLVNKESDRVAKTAELLTKAGFHCQSRADGMQIFGGAYQPSGKSFSFDPDNDHRLAFAAALLKAQGFKIKIKNPKVVNKSFPEFWQSVGVRP